MSELRFDDRAVTAQRSPKALEDRAAFARHAVGVDPRVVPIANRLVSSKALHRVTPLGMAIPRPGALSSASFKES